MIRKHQKILRFLFSVCLLTLSLGFFQSAYAETYEEMYGKELKSAPYAVRVRYANEMGHPWAEATYDERLNYLFELDRQETAEQIAKEQEANSKMQVEMQKDMSRQMAEVAEQNKEYEKQRQKIEKKLAEDRKKYDFQRKIMQQQQQIEKLRYQNRTR